ncbi:MAG: hypothetical protein CVU00_04395 [Bacteroidetes bacterium HGW-Bacteroidetes-17]|jgi:GLPGLI family protein|nr:MAG: hypothetical protein CVU00_04395 [Bacteroidetes bacterium HGW-Bacteroidetes-17]
MRKLIIILILANSLSALAQKPLFDHPIKVLDHARFIANYTLIFNEDSLNLNVNRKEDFLLFLGEYINLFIGKDSYYFKLNGRNITSREQLQQFVNEYAAKGVYSRFSWEFLKNYPNGKMTCYHHLTTGPFLYEEDLNLFDWQLTDSIDTIAGYPVQMATTDFGGRSWIAWFSPEIPFNDGPYKFNGLPGLIVKVYDTRMHYVFELKDIEKPDHEIAIEFYREELF